MVNAYKMIDPLKEDYTAEEIEKYLSDWDNLEDTGWFDNPTKNIADYTFDHKSCDDLKQFLSKGREIIRHRLMEKKQVNSLHEQDLLCRSCGKRSPDICGGCVSSIAQETGDAARNSR
jgi:hypothetical protein